MNIVINHAKVSYARICILGVFFLMISCSDSPSLSTSNIENQLRSNAWVTEQIYDMSIFEDCIGLSEEQCTYFFLENGEGVLRANFKKWDSDLGYIRRESPKEFSYSVTDNGRVIININSKSYEHKLIDNKKLVTNEGATLQSRVITSQDREWLTKAKYILIGNPGGVPIQCSIEPLGRGYQTDEKSGVMFWPVVCKIHISGSDYPSSRGVQTVVVTLKIKYGTGLYMYSKDNSKQIQFNVGEDKNYDIESDLIYVSGSDVVEFTVSAVVYSGKDRYNCENITPSSFAIRVPDYIGK